MSLDTKLTFPDLEEVAQMHCYTHPGFLSLPWGWRKCVPP